MVAWADESIRPSIQFGPQLRGRSTMKKFLLVGVSAAALGTGAFAADMPAKVPVRKAVAPFSWQGFDAGVNAGYGWGSSIWTDVLDGFFSTPGLPFHMRPKGALAGAHIGYNWQSGQSVFGIELSGDGGWMKNKIISPLFPAADTEQTKVSSIWSATAKLGFALDRNLVYLKGGYAGARIKINADSSSIDDGNVFFARTKTRNGLAFGGGLEHAITSNWLLGIEYDYYNFGSAHYTGFNIGDAVSREDFAVDPGFEPLSPA